MGSQQVRAREYFLPTIRKQSQVEDEEIKDLKRPKNMTNDSSVPILLASFRGRPLQGRDLLIPDNYRGFIVADSKSLKSSDRNQVPKYFDKFTYWNWDELPSKEDPVAKSLGWINISKAIHETLDD